MTAARTLPVTPAERHLATILRAAIQWGDSEDEPEGEEYMSMLDLGRWLKKERLLADNGEGATPAGAALLARVEAAPLASEPAGRGGCSACQAITEVWLFQRSPARVPDYYCAACIRSAVDAPPAKEPR